MPETFGPRVASARRKRGWSQQDLAVAAGLSIRVVAKVERGGSPSTETLRKLGEALGLEFRIGRLRSRGSRG